MSDDRDEYERTFRHFSEKVGLPRSEEFEVAVKARTDAGFEEYGDKSLNAPVSRTFEELEQELLDIPGWLYILFRQLPDDEWRRIEYEVRCVVSQARRLRDNIKDIKHELLGVSG